MDFAYDVFISYNHLDNKPISKDGEGWISRFYYSLNIRLAQLLGREPKIWFDHELKGNDEFSDEIIDTLNKTKVLLTIMSPGYLNSPWCKKELDHFLKAAGKSNIGTHMGNKSRVFKAVKTHVPNDRHPDALKGLLGHEFCKLAEKQNFIEFSDEKGSEYWMRLNELAGDIYRLIEEMDQPDKTGIQSPVNPPGKSIYLAETTSDLRDVRDNIRRDLTLQGYTIFPDRPLPYFLKDGKLSDCVHEYLKRCKLSIHIIGKEYGLVPEGEERSIIQIQEDLAARLCENEQLKRLTWLPPDSDEKIVDARQKEYMSVLQNDAPQVPGTDLLKTSVEDFKTVIRDTLDKINKPPVIKKVPDAALRVYLVFDRRDRDAVKFLDDCLYNRGFEVMPTLLQGSETERRRIHKDNLCLCDALLIYYDNANEYWMQSMFNDWRKAPGYGRTKPINKCAIFVGGEKTEHKKSLRSREAQVIRIHDGPFTCDVLSPFTAQLLEGMGGGR